MTRIDPDALATHIEVALTCAPLDTLTALQDRESQRRRRATFILAQHLADRLGCFEISAWPRSLFMEADRQPATVLTLLRFAAFKMNAFGRCFTALSIRKRRFALETE